jgi:hypothetical protein
MYDPGVRVPNPFAGLPIGVPIDPGILGPEPRALGLTPPGAPPAPPPLPPGDGGDPYAPHKHDPGTDPLAKFAEGAASGKYSPEVAAQLIDLYLQLLGTLQDDVPLGFDLDQRVAEFIAAAERGDVQAAVTGLQSLVQDAQRAAEFRADERERGRVAQRATANRLLVERQTVVAEGNLGERRREFTAGREDEVRRAREFETEQIGLLAARQSGAQQAVLEWIGANSQNLAPPGGTSEASSLLARLAGRTGATAAPPVTFDGPTIIPPFLGPFDDARAAIAGLS